jgi:sigma-B regulation protein RsbU (phosphoserine phosphatase)
VSARAAGAALAVPLLAKNDIAGVLLPGQPLGRAEFSAAEKRALQSCAGQFALMMENARLTDRMVEQEKLSRDIQPAAEVQKRLFPDNSGHCRCDAGWDLAAGPERWRRLLRFLRPGGPAHRYRPRGRCRKRYRCALITSVVQASLRILATEENASPATLAARMNRFLHRSTGSNAYATFFYAQIDEQSRQLRYVNAGHNPPCLLRCSADQGARSLGCFRRAVMKRASSICSQAMF